MCGKGLVSLTKESNSMDTRMRRALVFLVAPAVLYIVWGAAIPVIKLALVYFPPVLLAGYRFTLGGLLLGVLMVAMGRSFVIPRGRWVAVFCVGLVVYVLANSMWFWAIGRIHGVSASIINGLNPLFSAALSLWAFHEEAATPRKLIGLTLGLLGVATVSGWEGSQTWPSFWGVIVAVGACFVWSVGLLGIKWLAQEMPTMAMTFYQMLTSGVILMILGFAVEDSSDVRWSLAGIGYLLLLVAVSVSTFLLFTRLTRKMDLHKIVVYNYLAPLAGGVVSLIALKETLQPFWMVSVALIVAAIVLVTGLGRRRGRKIRAS